MGAASRQFLLILTKHIFAEIDLKQYDIWHFEAQVVCGSSSSLEDAIVRARLHLKLAVYAGVETRATLE